MPKSDIKDMFQVFGLALLLLPIRYTLKENILS